MTRSSLLLLTSDEALAASVHQLAAAAGVSVEHVSATGSTDSSGAPGARASLVLSDVEHLDTSAIRRRRDAPLHVLAPGPVPDVVYRRALDAGALGVVAVPADLPRLSELLADLDRPRQGRVVAVTGGSGGVGTSVTAAALALRAAEVPTMLVDLDPWGPGLARVLGGRLGEGITWDDLSGVDGRLSASELAAALPREDDLALLSWPDDGAVPVDDRLAAEVVAAGARGHDWVVIDCPRGAVRSPDLLGLCDLVLLLVSSDVAGVASAARAAAPLRAAGAPVGLVVRGSGTAVAGTEVSRLLGLPLVAEVGHDRRLREHVDAGLGPVRGRRSSLVRAADEVLALLEAGRDVGEAW
jgi:secretion/DNA translocation related CpaE-like protein